MSTPGSSEWGTCPNCNSCGFVGNFCSIFGESLVSMVIGKVMMRTTETAVENFLHTMAMESSKPDVEHHIDSQLELFNLCGMTTVFDVVAHSYRLHQANRFDYMNEKTGEMTIVAVCNKEYELFCEVGAIWLLHQHRMQPSHQQPYLIPSQRRMFQNNRRDLGAVTFETERNSSVSENKSMKKYLWIGESDSSYHLTNNTASMFDCSRIHSYLKIGHGKYMYSSKIGKKKVTIVQSNCSILDLILCDCIFVPDICINLFSITKALNECWILSNHGLLMVLSQADLKITFDQTLKTTHGYVCGVTMLPLYDSKGVVIDIKAREKCFSPFGVEPVFDYTPDKPFRSSDILSAQSKIYFAKSSFHQSNSDPNVKQQIATNNLIDWTTRTMKDNLVTFKTRFKHCFFDSFLKIEMKFLKIGRDQSSSS
jgi:hypothetical protein